MEEKKLNKNALRSKRLIRQALIELIKKESIDKVSITEIVNVAGVNRATFYAHYSCIKDLTDEIENEIIDKLYSILTKFKFDNFSTNPTPLLLQISLFLEEDIEYYRTLVKAPETRQFLDRIMKIFRDYMLTDSSIPKEIRESKSFQIRTSCFAGGLINLYLDWFKGELDCSLYDIPLEVSQIFLTDTITK